MDIPTSRRPRPTAGWPALLRRGVVTGGQFADLVTRWLTAAADPRARLLRRRRRALRWGLVFGAGCLFWVLVTTTLASWSTPAWVLLVSGLIAAGAAAPATVLLLRYRWLRSVPLPAHRPAATRRLPPHGSAARPAMSALSTSERSLFSLLGVLERGRQLPSDQIEDLAVAANRTAVAMAATAAEVVSMERTGRFTPDAAGYLLPTIAAYTTQLGSGARQYNELVTAAAQLVSSANGGYQPDRHDRQELTAATDRLVGWAQAFDELGGLSRPGLLRTSGAAPGPPRR